MSDLLTTFKQYLINLKLSPISRKLYLSDVSHFLAWLGEDPTLDLLTSRVSYTRYIESLRGNAAAESMIKRALASLKQFGAYVSLTYSVENPTSSLFFAPQNGENHAQNVFSKYIKQFSNYLNEEHLSPLTIKSYKSDITRYLDWASHHVASTKISSLLNDENSKKYLNHLTDSGSAIPSTIERKSKSLARFSAWLSNVYPTLAIPDNTDTRPASAFRPFSIAQSRSEEIGAVASPDQTLISVKKNNYRKLFPFAWPSLSLASTVSLAILLLFVSALGVFGYNQFAKNVRLTAAYPSTPVTPNRQISFQGRLEDAAGTPITTATNLTFKLFDAATSGTQLYSSGACSITPDSDGVFSTQIGGTCGSTIASSVFTENANVYLEVTVVAETLSPRQQIASVAYALNSETLQGFPIAATVAAIRNTVVPMNQWGEILVGEQSPRLTGVSGTFQISAPALSLTTATGSNGNITFAPDGTGQVNVNGNTTSTNFFNVSNAQLTTGSLITGTAANNNTGFKLINLLSGATPTSKFSVDNAGNTTISGTLTLPNGNTLAGVTNYAQFTQGISVGGSTTYHLDGSGNLNVNDATVNGTLNANGTANIGNGTAPVTLNGTSITLTGFNCSTFANGGALTTNSSGVVTCSNDDNSGGGGGGSSMWQDDGGAISPINSTWDVLIGGTATGSAKFKFLNVNANVPTASISGTTTNVATFIDGNGHISTTNQQSLIIGNSDNSVYNKTGDILLNPSGLRNVGIGNANPGQILDVTGNVQFSGALMPGSSAGTSGQFLISGGAGAAPTWTSTVTATAIPFSGVTAATNINNALLVGNGSSLDFTGTGTINASTLLGHTWAAPGTIGSTTPSTGAFTTLTTSSTASISGILTVGNGTTNTIQSAFGPLTLNYKSGLNTWATDISLQDTTGNIDLAGGVGSTGCTITNSNGNLDCTGAITGSSFTGGVSFGNLTSGTNTAASMLVGTGASLGFTGTGTINASTLLSGTWAVPGTIGSTTPNTGAFTNISATGNITQTGSGTFSTGTGVTSLNGSSTNVLNQINFAGGTTYFVDNAGNAKFLDLQAVDTGNPGLTVGNGSIGFIKVGGSTISDNAGDLTLSSDTSSLALPNATTIIGVGDGSTPTATTIRGAAGAGTNILGANLTIDASNGTGAAGSGSLIFRTAPGTATTAVSVDSSSSSGASSATTMSWSHTVSGTNRLLTVGVSMKDNSSSVTSITYGAQSLTKLGAISQGTGNHPRSEIWYLIAPNTGSNTITVTTGASTFMEGGAVSFNNVNQTIPVGAYASNTGTAGATASVTVASVNGDLVLDALANWSNVGASTPDPSQTQRYNTTSDGAWRGAGSTKTGSASVTMSWTLGGSQDWALSGVSIHNVGNSGVDTLTTRLLIDQNGNVGIDNATPTQALDVTGNATVSGNVTMGGQLQIGRFAAQPTALGAGSEIFNTTTNTFQCNNGTIWSDCAGTLYDNTNLTVANGSFITVAHNQNTNNLLATGWVQDAITGLWNTITNLAGTQVVQNLQNQWNEALSTGLIHTTTDLTDIKTTGQVNTGTGADGAITIAGTVSINAINSITGRSCADGGDAVNYSITGLTSTTATLSTTPSAGCLNVGDEVLIINQQGTSSNYNNVGNWETLRISQISANTITFTTSKTKFYGANTNDDTNIGTTQGSNQLVMLQRVPNYTNVTVNASANFTPSTWSSPKGGVMFFRASGTVTVAATGTINANGDGYQGSAATRIGGESFCGLNGGGNGASSSVAATAGTCGGGGGGSNTSGLTAGAAGSLVGGAGGGGGSGGGVAHGGGGGGGYGTGGTGGGINGQAGSTSSGNGGSSAVSSAGGGGGGGGTYGDASLTHLFFGSSGGSNAGTATLPGLGGGIIYIAANTISVSGGIQSNGTTGGGSGVNGGTGGGAGGSVRLEGTTLNLGSSLVTASGGAGASASTTTGGNGGSGIIAINYTSSIAGSTSPTASQSLVGTNTYGLFHSNPITVSNTQNLQAIRWEQAGYAIPTGNGETMTDAAGEVAQWNFNQTSGTSATNDAGSTTCGGTGSNCNGTLTSFANTGSQDAVAGSGWTATDRRWGAGSLAFDGTNDTVDIGNQSALSFDRTSAFSAEAWVKTSAVAAGTIISKEDSNSPNSGWELNMQSTGALKFNLINTVTTNQIAVTTNNTINDGKWHHVAATYDGTSTAGGVKIYIDGVVQGVTNNIDNLTGSTTNTIHVYIGSRNNATNYFNGTIDAVAVYSRVLSAKEISANSQQYAGQIEMETRTGSTLNPADGTWETWKGVTSTNLNNANTFGNWTGTGLAVSDGNITRSIPMFEDEAIATGATANQTTKLAATNFLPDTNQSLSTSITSFWNMNEASGSRADSAGVNTLTDNGTTPSTTGVLGNAINPNGSTQFLSCTDANCGGTTTSGLDIGSGSLSISAWVYNSGAASRLGTQALVTKGTVSGQYSFEMYLATGSGTLAGPPVFDLNNTDVTGTVAHTYLEASSSARFSGLSVGWHHLVGVFDQSTPKITLYVDNVSAATSSTPNGTLRTDSTSDFRIASGGAVKQGTALNAAAVPIDEVGFWKKALSTSEINDLYNAAAANTFTANGQHADATIASTDISGKDYISFWVQASQAGSSVKFGFGQSAATEQEYTVNVDSAGVWQKVYWNITNIPPAKRSAVTKLRFTNLANGTNNIYIDSVQAESDLSTAGGSNITSTPNTYIQYRAILTTTNTNYQPVLNNVSLVYNNGYKLVQQDANNARLYNYTGSTQALKLDVTGAGFTNPANPWTNAGSYLYPTGFQSLRVYDGSGVHYLGLANDGTNINFSYDGTTKLSINSTGDLLPGSNNTQSLGSNSLRYKDLFLGPNTLHIGTSTSDEYTLGYNTASNYLGFYLNGAGTPTLVMDGSNNVGIGLTNPAATLNTYHGVSGAPATSGSTDTAIGDRFGVGVVGLDFGTYTAGGSWIQNRNITDYSTNYDLALEPNGGNVGIGNSLPGFGLDVEAVTGSTNAKFGSALPLYVVSNNPNLGYNAYYNSGWFYGKGSSGNYAAVAGFNAANGRYNISLSTGTGNAGTSVSTLATDFTIDGTTGDVGIGVAGPVSPLDIAYTTSSTGSQTAGIREAPVTLNFTDAATTTHSTARANTFNGITYTGTNASQTITTASTLFLGTPLASTNVTITNTKILDTQQGAFLSGAGVWTNGPSYRRYKEDFTPTGSYLDKLANLDVYEWQYKDEVIDGQNRYSYDPHRHASPFLDDFYNTFGLGTEDGYNIQDLAGVTIASVKELNTRFVDFKAGQGIALSSIGDVNIETDNTGNYVVVKVADNTPLTQIVAFGQVVTGNLKSGIGSFQQLLANQGKIGNLQVGTISPLASNQPIAITGPVTIQNAPGSTDAGLVVDGTIEAATISARVAKLNEIEADTITANNIVADTITANHITGLDSQIASMAGNLSDSQIQSITDRIKARLDTLTGNIPTAADLPSPAVASSAGGLLTNFPENTPIASDAATLASLDADFVTINNYLAVIGQATITTLDVTNTLNTNTLQSKTGTLALQPLGGMINLANNTLIVDSTGEVAINGNLTVNGQILAKSAEINTLSLGTPNTATSSSELGQLLSIYNEQGQAVATIDASGSANLAAVTTQLITIASPATASASAGLDTLTGNAQSNATAGESTLTSPNTELTINSPYVTANSLVYLTPTGNTDNKVLFVKSKNSCAGSTTTCTPSFTVGIDTPASSDISFNWWIIQLAPPKPGTATP